jgi:hypothetical protein
VAGPIIVKRPKATFSEMTKSMPLYFLLLDSDAFHRQITPALTASWRQRSFVPVRELARQLQAPIQTFTKRYHLGGEQPLLAAVANTGLAYDRVLWQHVAGELLWFSAADIPEIITSPDALNGLVADQRVNQVLYGSHDLRFGGGFYRPDQVGWNDTHDIAQFANFLARVRPESWTTDALAGMPQFADHLDRAEEVEFVRDWFGALVELYCQASQRRQVVICERVD